ncbi:hypothetical protein F5X99DRAFT_416213 [Biscogniauxia marginata]|nr:hypothetical protein F5X99DRAFT_416213 [Biscogniauxia marginata]
MRDGPESHDDLPIALRRTPRKSLGSATVTSAAASAAPSPTLAQAQKTADHPTSSTRTPSKPKSKPKAISKKGVRFSDPGPDIQEDEHHGPSSSTGLTPMVRRSSLGERETAITASPSHKRKRHSAPTRRLADEDDEDDELANNSNEIRIIPLRQVLDDRLKRRIRRNGLSEEMNTISESRRRRLQEQKAEVQRLRDELAEKNAEIGRLHSCNSSVNSSGNSNTAPTEGASGDQDDTDDTARIALLEQQVQDLRNKLRDRALENDAACATGRHGSDDGGENNWTLAARDPYSGSYMDMDTMMDVDEDMDDSGFGETTMAELVCSTPSKKRPSAGANAPRSASASFPTPPCTSPLLPSTPCSTWPAATEALTPTRRTPRSYNTGVQASLPDPEKEALEAELGSLRRELAKLTGALESHAALQSRIADKLVRANTGPSTSTSSSVDDSNTEVNDADIEAHLDSVLQTLSDRTSTLLELDSSLGRLGFPGNDAASIVASLASSFRSARLELEYLTPGELTLPLSSRGAEVLDLVLSRLRDLGRRAREHDEAIDEYHELELSLRQQLGARIDAADAIAAELRNEKAHAAELELGLDRLKTAAEGYRRDIAELERLVQRAEEEGRAKTEAETAATVAHLETRLVDALAGAADLRARLGAARDGTAELNRAHGEQLREKDAGLAALRRELDGADRALREAREGAWRARAERAGERRRAGEVLGRMREGLERVLGLGGELLGGMAGEGVGDGEGVGGEGEGQGECQGGGGGAYFSGEKARRGSSGVQKEKEKERGRGKEKKRRYDSGLGFADEDEDGVEMVG